MSHHWEITASLCIVSYGKVTEDVPLVQLQLLVQPLGRSDQQLAGISARRNRHGLYDASADYRLYRHAQDRLIWTDNACPAGT